MRKKKLIKKSLKKMKKKSKKKTKSNSKQEDLAVIRLRGSIDLNSSVKDTLKSINLYKKNSCVVITSNPDSVGKLKRVKDYVTWGEIDKDTYDMLVEKRGEEYKRRLADSKEKINYNKFIEIKNKKYKKYFRLHPPIGGFRKKGIKVSYKKGGATGYRGKEINSLIKKMI
ncbi:50S ribosomal protein L30 [Candidatus Woesearchaeota archaeon]|nr:50S ribosomal protein L30 [Candidatus Woesearchaeota archaeon]